MAKFNLKETITGFFKKLSKKQLIAVIAAAIAMAENECGSNKQFRVVSFNRK